MCDVWDGNVPLDKNRMETLIAMQIKIKPNNLILLWLCIKLKQFNYDIVSSPS